VAQCSGKIKNKQFV